MTERIYWCCMKGMNNLLVRCFLGALIPSFVEIFTFCTGIVSGFFFIFVLDLLQHTAYTGGIYTVSTKLVSIYNVASPARESLVVLFVSVCCVCVLMSKSR